MAPCCVTQTALRSNSTQRQNKNSKNTKKIKKEEKLNLYFNNSYSNEDMYPVLRQINR